MLTRQGGATLIEVLVSVVIASVGLLALAGINAASLRYSKVSQYRAAATLLAADIAERMRANRATPAAVGNYQFVQPLAAQAALVPPAPACDTLATPCTPAQLAAQDLFQWRRTVRDTLPSGAVFLLPDAAAAGAVDLWIAWREPEAATGDEVVRTGGARECPAGLDVGGEPTVRCLFFRVML